MNKACILCKNDVLLCKHSSERQEVCFTSLTMWYIIRKWKRQRTLERGNPCGLFCLPALYIFHGKEIIKND